MIYTCSMNVNNIKCERNKNVYDRKDGDTSQ